MYKDVKVTILGCGSSAGVPLVTGNWGACNPQNPKNYRTRCSAAVFIEGETWLLDVSPDVRGQLLRENITEVHGVLCTHAHFDHVGGIPELKPLAIEAGGFLPLYSDEDTLKILYKYYPYAFFTLEKESVEGYNPFIKAYTLDDNFCIGSTPVKFFSQNHRYSRTLGFRFPQWAYSTDIWALDENAESFLHNLEVWFVDCLRIKPAETHSHLEQTLSWIEKLKPKRAVLIHMSQHLDYDMLCDMLPPHVIPAFDGMSVFI